MFETKKSLMCCGEALGGISCVYDLWAYMKEGVVRRQRGGVSCVYDWWARRCRNASQYLPMPPKLRGIGNSWRPEQLVSLNFIKKAVVKDRIGCSSLRVGVGELGNLKS